MRTDDTHVLDLLPAYALGCLDEDEAGQVAGHLAGCLVCRDQLAVDQATVADLALSVPGAAPPPDLKPRLMERIQAPRGAAPRPRPRPALRPRLLPAWGVLSLILLLALTATNLWLWQRLDQLEVAQSGGMRALPLHATGVVPEASGLVVVGADGLNGALVVDQLPPPEAGHEYQLWLLRDGQATSGAVFSTDETAYRGLRISAPESLFNYSAVSVTVEPAGGSAQPTGAEVLAGPLFAP